MYFPDNKLLLIADNYCYCFSSLFLTVIITIITIFKKLIYNMTDISSFFYKKSFFTNK